MFSQPWLQVRIVKNITDLFKFPVDKINPLKYESVYLLKVLKQKI